MSDKYPVRLTITFNDGSTEDFDVFIAVGATGLIPAGREDDHVLYAAGERLDCRGMARIAATPEVTVALMQSIMGMVSRLIDSAPPELLPGFLAAMLSLSTDQNVLYHKMKIVKRNQG